MYMKICDRIDKQIKIIYKTKYATVKYDVFDYSMLGLSRESVEKIYNFVKTLPLQRSSMFAFSSRFIDIDVLKGHEYELADFIRAVARAEFSDMLDQDDVRLMKEYHESEIASGQEKMSKCPCFSASYDALMQMQFE